MTGFDILLCCVNVFIICLIIAIKYTGKPRDVEDWLVSISLALLIILTTVSCIIFIYLIGNIIWGIFTSINWHNFLTQKVI